MMTEDLTTTPVTTAPDDPAPEKTPAEYKRWVKNQIRRGLLPRFKVSVTKVKTGSHPKQHRLEYKLESTLALLTAPCFTDPGFTVLPPPAKGPVQCNECYGMGRTSSRKAGAFRLKPCKTCKGTGFRPEPPVAAPVATPSPSTETKESPNA